MDPPEPYEPDYTTLMHDMMEMTKERDELKRKIDDLAKMGIVDAARVYDLRIGIAAILSGQFTGSDKKLAEEVLASTPSQAEKRVEAMKALCYDAQHLVERWRQGSDSGTSALVDSADALTALEKEE